MTQKSLTKYISLLRLMQWVSNNKKSYSIPAIFRKSSMAIVPKGCKQYFFYLHGEHSTEEIIKSTVIFKCIALNDKNAVRKFNNWKK
jgi:hypothetical protein